METNHLEDKSTDEEIILKWVLREKYEGELNIHTDYIYCHILEAGDLN
jgi:hypothetical protein